MVSSWYDWGSLWWKDARHQESTDDMVISDELTFDNPTLSQELLTLLLPGDLDWPSIQASFLTNRHIKRYMKNQHHDTSRAFNLLIIHHLHILSLPTPSINLSLLQTLLKLLWDILQLLQFLLESTRRTAGDGACIFREGG